MPISACWIAKDEDAVLERSIRSVMDAVDDMVVVDTGSSDHTVEIAESLGARVEHFQWIDDFAAARNYAMSLVKHDIVIFLDADEWFMPALKREDGPKIERFLQARPTAAALSLLMRHMHKTGELIVETTQLRVLRRSPEYTFSLPIHEQYTAVKGGPIVEFQITDWMLLHDGYDAAISRQKAMRNIAILEDHLSGDDSVGNKVLSAFYMVREAYTVGENDRAWRALRYALDHPEYIKVMAKYTFFLSVMHYAFAVAENNKDKCSRKEIWDKLYKTQHESPQAYPGKYIDEIAYLTAYDLKEDRILGRIDADMANVRNAKPFVPKLYEEAQAKVYAAAAYAADRRGDTVRAFDYAVDAIRLELKFGQSAVPILLKSMKGQQAPDILEFLNHLFNSEQDNQLDFMVAQTRREGFLDVYAYYLMKHFKKKGVGRLHQIDLFFTQQRYDDAVQAILSTVQETGAEHANVIHAYMVAICVCADADLHRRYAETMPDGVRIAEAYFTGEAPSDLTEAEVAIFPSIYQMIALVGGTKKADRFARVFSNRPELVMPVRAAYLFNAWRYEEILAWPTKGIPQDRYAYCSYLMQAHIYLGHYEDAYALCKRFLEEHDVRDGNLLLGLQVIVEDFARRNHPLAEEARSLHHRYAQLRDRFIDWGDVVKSGYVVDEFPKNRTRKLKTLTMEGFLAQLREEEADTVITADLSDVALDAGNVYEKAGMRGMAMLLYRLPWQRGDEAQKQRAAQALTRLFFAEGNRQLAEAFT